MRNDRARLDQIVEDATSGGWAATLFAEEEDYDRAALWRFGSWGAASVAAITAAMLVANFSGGIRRERVAFAEMSRQTSQLQTAEKDVRNENRRLSAAVDTLNTDRDRLFARVTVVEQNLDSVTGSIGKPSSWPASLAAPVIGTPAMVTSAMPVSAMPASASPVSTMTKSEKLPEAAAPLPPVPVKTFEAVATPPSEMKAPPAEAKAHELDQPAATEAPLENASTVAALTSKESGPETVTEKPIPPAEFGVDLGSANSVEGLRALWRGTSNGWPALLGSLQPLIVVREGQDGLGMRLHLVAGPLTDAAAAAKLCANLISSRHRCETTLFDGQRLAMQMPTTARPPKERVRRSYRSRAEKRVEEPVQQPPSPPAPAQTRGLSSIFNR